MKFSVLLPTKNRLELLKFAIESVFEQDYENWEIIVADNCSEENINEYINSLSDKRIIYTRSDVPLTVTENWNVANNLARGDYIIMMGDDDALFPGFFTKALNHIEAFSHPDLVTFPAYGYLSPGVLNLFPQGGAFLTRSYPSAGAFFLEKDYRSNLVRSSLNFHFLFGFNMQFFLYSKRILNKMLEYGDFYQGPYPDYYAANMMMFLAETVLQLTSPMVVIGTTPKSYGYYYHNNKESLGMAFHNESDYIKKAPAIIANLLCSKSIINSAALLSFKCVVDKLGEEATFKLNIEAYNKAVVRDVCKNNRYFKSLFILLKDILPKVSGEIKFKIFIYFLRVSLTIDRSLPFIKDEDIDYTNILSFIKSLEEKGVICA
ncbi:MAG: glycosyltransferase family 2 protein [Candidatus Gastranaerophilales bacterium]|nr:glycosyltransferase family 2 protein [Candidatus Gastranaerophilales bacterium]